ncbi:hypothetical protein CCHL11_07571 [Colletotrichum chlorophyti]|uniref:Uncharacterized protein n=1 Tax=Colletotrichum chlorophyti TaxID=708187 RepID=A0A1Q8RZT5_9PEZI|nr:hypothetical protein CCHL11_07571 [Colletotrichum chlorophyti]
MVYHTCCILLFKPFLVKSKEGPAAPKTDAVRRAETLCIESAKRICHTGKKYRQVFGSFRRSPITATHCVLTAALVLIQYAAPDPDFANTGRPCCTVYIEACLEILAELSTSWNPAGRMRTDLIRLLYQKYPERIPSSLLHLDRKNLGKPSERESASPCQPNPTLEQNLCPLMSMIDQDIDWDAANQGFQGPVFNGVSESAFNTQFALADSILPVGEPGATGLTDDDFWAGVNLDFAIRGSDLTWTLSGSDEFLDGQSAS